MRKQDSIEEGIMATRRKKSWIQKLTKKEQAHLRETIDSRISLERFRSNRAGQREMKKRDGREPCWECRCIARKIGLEE
jgi:hypothetical protein